MATIARSKQAALQTAGSQSAEKSGCENVSGLMLPCGLFVTAGKGGQSIPQVYPQNKGSLLPQEPAPYTQNHTTGFNTTKQIAHDGANDSDLVTPPPPPPPSSLAVVTKDSATTGRVG
jgi:hypothetical protein